MRCIKLFFKKVLIIFKKKLKNKKKKVVMRLISIHVTVKRMSILKSKCDNLHNVQLFFAFKNCRTSIRIFLQTGIMVDGAKFNSHDSVGHF